MKNFYLLLTILIFAGQAFGQANKKLGVEAQSHGVPALKFGTPPPASASAKALPTTVIWGDNPGEGDFDGGLNGWTIESVSDSTALWYWSVDTTAVGGFFSEIALASETADNGIMTFNADYMTTQGIEANLPDPPYPIHTGDLISPTIDMSNALDPQLLFTQAFRGFTIDGNIDNLGAFLAYSTDDGVTWSDFEPVNSNLGSGEYSENPDSKRIDIPDLAGEATVKIKFRYSGDFYFWMIDDVKIVERPPHNLAISSFGVAVSEYFIAPTSQVSPVYFGGYVSNLGGADQSNVTLDATVDAYDLSGNLLTDDMFSGSTSIDVLASGMADSLLLFDVADTFTPPSTDDQVFYEINYQLSQDSTDAVPDDNTSIADFLIYDGYYSKAAINAGFEPIRTAAYRPQDAIAYEYGVHMYVPNGDEINIAGVQFSYAANGALEGNGITIILREWDDLNGDAVPTDDELEIVAFNVHSFTTEENYDLITIALLDNTTQEEGFIMKDNTHYILTGAYDGSEEDVFMAVDESIEYDPSIDASIERYVETGDSDLIRFADVLYVDGEWGIRGFNIVGVPSISLITTDVEVAIEDAQGVPVQVSLHPNPASDILNIAMTTEISNDDWKVSISDISGRSVLWNRTATQADFPLQVNINELAKGAYMLTLENNGQIHTERFVKK